MFYLFNMSSQCGLHQMPHLILYKASYLHNTHQDVLKVPVSYTKSHSFLPDSGPFFWCIYFTKYAIEKFFLSLLSCDTKFLQVSNSKDIFFKDLGAVSLKCNDPELHFLPSVYLREKTPKTSLRIPYQGDRTTPQAHIHIYHCPELSPRLLEDS